jgi:uncharacterized Zn finger protein (UPF0148 family)
MTCRYCGTPLPDGALFCGECGQPVAAASDETATGTSVIVAAARSARSAGGAEATSAGSTAEIDLAEPEDSEDSEEWESESSRPSVGFSIADLAFSSPGETSQPEDDDRDLPDGSPLDGTSHGGGDSGDSAARCPQCGEAMAQGDVFCGECGFVVRTVTPPSGINLITLGEFPADPDAPTTEAQALDADATTEVERLGVEELDDDAAGIDHLVVESGPAFAPPEPEGDPDLEFDDPLPFPEPEVKPAAKGSPRSRPIPDPFPWGTEQPLREDLEATRLVADSASGTRYVLQFSTGESVTVAGSGLIGRNPSMQPGEYVDQLVPIFDAGKSVSKTHLEFGQEAGRFWVSDRYSTNGSVIRQPEAEPRRCDAGRRYFIARGTRVDVGEQFFVVS